MGLYVMIKNDDGRQQLYEVETFTAIPILQKEIEVPRLKYSCPRYLTSLARFQDRSFNWARGRGGQ